MGQREPLFARDAGWGEKFGATVWAASPTLNIVQVGEKIVQAVSGAAAAKGHTEYGRHPFAWQCHSVSWQALCADVVLQRHHSDA